MTPLILPMGKPIMTCRNVPSKNKRHHCVSFCDDITVVEFECDACVKSSPSFNKPPLCVSRNLKNSLFLPQPVSKFFDRYQSRESEKRNILSIAKDPTKRILQRKCSLPHDSPDKLSKVLKLELFNNKFPVDNKDDFLSMSNKEKQWLASIQIHQLDEMQSTDYYFKKFMAKTHPGQTLREPADYLKEMKTASVKTTDLKKPPSECASPDMKSCLGKIPMFTVAHARQVLEDKVVPPNPQTGRSSPLLTIEYYYELLSQLQEEKDADVRESLVRRILRADDLPQFMNISKGQKLYFKLYFEMGDDRFLFWQTIFRSLPLFFKLNKSTRPLNMFLSLFRFWLMSNDNLAYVSALGESIEDILSFVLANNFGISIISLLVICSTNVKVILNSDEVYRENWATFLTKLVQSLDHHPHVEMPLLGSRKHMIQVLKCIAPSQVDLNNLSPLRY